MNKLPKRLKETAIPSLHLPFVTKTSESERSKRMKLKEQKQMIENLLIDEGSKKRDLPEDMPSCSNSILQDISNVQSPYEILFQKYRDLQEQCEQLKNQAQCDKQEIERLITTNEKLQLDAENNQKTLDSKLKEFLSDFLTPNQIEILLKDKTKARWSSEEISKAFTLRYFSKRAYIYVRETLKYPLPGISTLQRWASNIDLQHGLLKEIIKIMDISGKDKNDFERVTVLSYDEIKVSSLIEYHQKMNEIVGPHSYMQVIMARGLFSSWKQPVFIGFDTKMTKALLEETIIELNSINYDVVACVSDCGGGNIGLWKELDITINNTYFAHPVTGNKIHIFADVPHTLKLIRNWLLDHVFILEDGTVITKEPIVALINDSRSEISSIHKLTKLHISCEKAQRQNVTLAAQLLSHTTATALKRYCPGPDKKLAQNVGEFIDLTNKWFDILNSYCPSETIDTKIPYGKNLNIQNMVLDQMGKTILNMRAISKPSIQIFQKAVFISTSSVKNLFNDMKDRYKISYILTHRLNQDCLENLFCQIRSRGGLHDHPAPLNAIYRLRMILLGKNPGMVQKNPNTQNLKETNEEEFILCKALKQANVESLKEVAPKKTSDEELSSEISSTTSSEMSSKQMIEKDGLIYIAGYLARKHQKEFPELGTYTYKNEAKNLHSYAMPSWVQSLSFGGLTEPSSSWQRDVELLDKWFLKIHKEEFKFNKKIVNRTTNIISKKEPLISKKLIYSFVRQRVFVRIKYRNMKKYEGSSSTNKRKRNSDEHRKFSKKMKKTVT